MTELVGTSAAAGEQYVVEVGVRWGDQDALGHVNHAVAVLLMAEARMQWLGLDAPAEGFPDFREPKVVASLTVEYGAPVEYGSPLTMAMRVSRIGRKSYTLVHEAIQNGERRFIGWVVLVPRDPESGRSREVTARERMYLERFLRVDDE